VSIVCWSHNVLPHALVSFFFWYCLVPVAINFIVSGAHTKCPSLQ
jgi:uncharacterized membrane protein